MTLSTEDFAVLLALVPDEVSSEHQGSTVYDSHLDLYHASARRRRVDRRARIAFGVI
jgi:hypothetical protein